MLFTTLLLALQIALFFFNETVRNNIQIAHIQRIDSIVKFFLAALRSNTLRIMPLNYISKQPDTSTTNFLVMQPHFYTYIEDRFNNQ